MKWFIAIAFTLISILLIHAFWFQITVVDGEAMEPTLSSGERVIVDIADHKQNAPRRGEVVIC